MSENTWPATDNRLDGSFVHGSVCNYDLKHVHQYGINWKPLCKLHLWLHTHDVLGKPYSVG